jgi:4-hydroxy-3-polyprenylbenzoate decarboxylase
VRAGVVMFASLRAFVETLEGAGELVRIRRECDPKLEIAEIANRTMKLPGGGPALLFENVRGSHFPLAINLYGSKRRMAMALGVANIEEHAHALAELVGGAAAPGGSLWEKLKMLPKLARVAGALPRSASGAAPCQEIV